MTTESEWLHAIIDMPGIGKMKVATNGRQLRIRCGARASAVRTLPIDVTLADHKTEVVPVAVVESDAARFLKAPPPKLKQDLVKTLVEHMAGEGQVFFDDAAMEREIDAASEDFRKKLYERYERRKDQMAQAQEDLDKRMGR